LQADHISHEITQARNILYTIHFVSSCFRGRSVYIETKCALACLVLLLMAGPARGQSVTYSKDVAPLLADRCGMCHHPGGAAPFTLLTYADAQQRGGQIATVPANRFMPPWKAEPADGLFVGQHPLSVAETAM